MPINPPGFNGMSFTGFARCSFVELDCKDEGFQGAQPEAMNSNKSIEYPYTTDVFWRREKNIREFCVLFVFQDPFRQKRNPEKKNIYIHNISIYKRNDHCSGPIQEMRIFLKGFLHVYVWFCVCVCWKGFLKGICLKICDFFRVFVNFEAFCNSLDVKSVKSFAVPSISSFLNEVDEVITGGMSPVEEASDMLREASHTIPINSWKFMGSLWEAYGKGVPFLGAPGNSLEYVFFLGGNFLWIIVPW